MVFLTMLKFFGYVDSLGNPSFPTMLCWISRILCGIIFLENFSVAIKMIGASMMVFLPPFFLRFSKIFQGIFLENSKGCFLMGPFFWIFFVALGHQLVIT